MSVIKRYNKIFTGSWRFRIFLLKNLPMGFLAGLRPVCFNEKECTVSVKYRWLVKNPFRSMYFAVQSMAAEASTGLLAMYHINRLENNTSMLVSSIEGKFLKRVTGRVEFRCTEGAEIAKAIELAASSGESVRLKVNSKGTDKDGEIVADYYIEWYFKKLDK